MKFDLKYSGRILIVLGAVLMPAVVTGALELPFTFKAGSPIKASEVNANFEALAARIDGLSASPKSKVVGTFTLEGVLDAAPIVSFSQSVGTDWVVGQAAKPQFSEIIIEREMGEGTPVVNRNLCVSKAHKTASLALGKLSIDLTNVLVIGVSSAGAGGSAREQIKLTFATIAWTWTEPGQPARVVEWDVAQAKGSGVQDRDYTFGYFPAGVEADAGYDAISGYTHNIGCATTSCKPQHSPVVITRPVAESTIDALGLAANGAGIKAVEVSTFSDASTVSNLLELAEGKITRAAISTAADGSLQEQSSFAYTEITWTAGNVTATYNVLLNK